MSGFVPKPDTVISPGDEVLVVLDPGLEPNIMAQFAPDAVG
jgi:trk system potassium uptake protein TrkA